MTVYFDLQLQSRNVFRNVHQCHNSEPEISISIMNNAADMSYPL